MIGYDEYMKSHPTVAKTRAERLREGTCYFVKDGRLTIALMPENSSLDELVSVDVTDLACPCNVFRTKKACPHVAAALGKIEQNGGDIPYTDVVSCVYESLNQLKLEPLTQTRIPAIRFLTVVEPLQRYLPEKQKPEFLLQVAMYMEGRKAQLSIRDFRSFCNYVLSWERDRSKYAKLLFQNRTKCYYALAILMADYREFLSETQEKTVLTEIISSPALAVRCLPALADKYAAAFPREQLLEYYEKNKKEDFSGSFLQNLISRLVTEKPPMYEQAIKMLGGLDKHSSLELEPEAVKALIQTGYGKQIEKMIEQLVSDIRSMNDYRRLIQFIPHELFLPAWRAKMKKKRSYWYDVSYKDWELEISFREDPEMDPDAWCLETFDCHVLETLLEVRPEARDAVNQAARKIYRRAMKENKREEAARALMVLVKGDDVIAVKYASSREFGSGNGEELIYRAVVGTHFNCLEKVAPELKKLEVSHAAGQN